MEVEVDVKVQGVRTMTEAEGELGGMVPRRGLRRRELSEGEKGP